MTYQQFCEEMNRRHTQASRPYMYGRPDLGVKNPTQSALYGKLLFELVDDPHQAIKNVERLLAKQNDSEVKAFYAEMLEELKASIDNPPTRF